MRRFDYHRGVNRASTNDCNFIERRSELIHPLAPSAAYVILFNDTLCTAGIRRCRNIGCVAPLQLLHTSIHNTVPSVLAKLWLCPKASRSRFSLKARTHVEPLENVLARVTNKRCIQERCGDKLHSRPVRWHSVVSASTCPTSVTWSITVHVYLWNKTCYDMECTFHLQYGSRT